MANNNQEPVISDSDIVLSDDQLICRLTNYVKKATEKELTLQYMIQMLIEEYGFDTNDLQRDYRLKYQDEDGKKRSAIIDIAVFKHSKSKDNDNLERVIVVAKDSKVNATDEKAGAQAKLEGPLSYTDCEFGCWTNGDDLIYLHKTEDSVGQTIIEDIADFPAAGQTMEELEASADKATPRKPANESLVRSFKRCHDYIYGNEGHKKDAFWQLLNLIFCKLYDEKSRFTSSFKGTTWKRRFWVGVKERNTKEGQKAVADRIKGIFNDLKQDGEYNDVFDGNEMISLSDAGIAFVASELSKYSFQDASVDVKGLAYETIVSNTLKQEAGQFFTPRNIIRTMVEILDPDENTRVLDPACGSGGFLVMVLDHVRRKITKSIYPNLDDLHLQAKANLPEVNARVMDYAGRMIFGFDFDPDLRKAARMNMVMAGDGHANIFNINSLDYPDGDLPDVSKVGVKVKNAIAKSYDKDCQFTTSSNNAQGKFDMIFTNPPFGSKVKVDPRIADKYNLNSDAPEVLFIEACYNFLKPGGKMAIVVPDGILGNLNMEETRKWILQHFIILASVDLPVESFLPQVGVQASLLFLQKKTNQEESRDINKEDYDVFMAIVEHVGKDRRGVPLYKKDEDGADLLFDKTKRWLSVDQNGNTVVREMNVREKELDDDLPLVSEAYKNYLLEGK